MPARLHQISISPPPTGGVPKRAVCLFSLEVIQRLQREGHPIGPGTTGENLTVSGIEWARLTPGTRVQVGDEVEGVELEIASYTQPCSTIRDSFTELKFKRIDQELHPGESRVYARVVKEGVVRVGDGVEVFER